MQFLYPTFLWALGALAVPIIIHLFHFRRFKKVQFTNVRFLKEIKEETASRSRIKNLLVLLMRCLALASLVFAFAQPYISDKETLKIGSKNISIFIDNSSSMKAELEGIPLLELAKSRARELVNTYSNEDRFQILTHDFEGKHQRLVGKEDALALIDELSITPEVKILSRVVNRQKQLLNGERNIIYLLSDFQRSITDLNSYQDTTIEVNLLPIQSIQEKNVSIDTAYFETPVPILNQVNNLIVKISNKSKDPAEQIKLSLIKDGQTKPLGLIDIKGNSTVTDTVPISILKPGFQQALVRITDYPIQFDDDLYVSYNVDADVQVLSINENGQNRYLTALFNGINYFELENQSLKQIQYQKFPQYDLILLNDLSNISTGLSTELIQYVDQGGKLVIFPSPKADLSSYNSLLSRIGIRLNEYTKSENQVSSINTEEFIFNDVFININRNIKLPKSNGYFSSTMSSSAGTEKILTLRNQLPFITKSNLGKGYIYTAYAPLDQDVNDLVLNAEIFVPMLYKMALATGNPEPLSYWIGQDNLIQLPNSFEGGEQVFTISGPSEFIPSTTNYGKSVIIDVNDQVREAGFYTLRSKDEDLRILAFNYDRRESDLQMYSASELSETLTNEFINVIDSNGQTQIASIITEKDQGVVLWKWFIFAALLFLLLETLLIRLFKN